MFAYLIDQEWVCEVEDIIWRRSKLGLRLSTADIYNLRQRLAPVVEGLRNAS